MFTGCVNIPSYVFCNNCLSLRLGKVTPYRCQFIFLLKLISAVFKLYLTHSFIHHVKNTNDLFYINNNFQKKKIYFPLVCLPF